MIAKSKLVYVCATVAIALAVVTAARAGLATRGAEVEQAPAAAREGRKETAEGGPVEKRVDEIFASWTHDTPGCAAGVRADGKPDLLKAYGMADLEHDVRNTTETIFEAGSVSKQFTAAAVLLLARDGKLSLDDPVRKYIPELPDYGVPLIIRHMLTHTSGLRDWGEVASIAGWPRTTRVHTHAHVLDIVSRQRSLNFTPGTKWSYSNTGYNLSAVIVSRVSGMPFARFTQERIFQPLGMTHTSWRDDFTRVVRNRAIAYSPKSDGYHQDMPFENVHGNGGLLTTVADLLRWNEHFVTPTIADARFVEEEQTPGRFSDGRAHDYAPGLYVRPYRGIPEVSHSGATAGYRAFLTRYPDQQVSIAVLCNAGNANPTTYAHQIAEIYLGNTLKPERPAAPPEAPAPVIVHPSPQELSSYAGQYESDEAEVVFTIELEQGDLVLKRRPDTVLHMRPKSSDAFEVPSLGTVTFHRDAGGQVIDLSVSLDRVWDLYFQRLRRP
jgi:CubicO group peptidase (beta-lactamase class C family)